MCSIFGFRFPTRILTYNQSNLSMFANNGISITVPSIFSVMISKSWIWKLQLSKWSYFLVNRMLVIATKGPSITDVGNCPEFLTPTPLYPMSAVYGNFDQFFTPPNCRRRLWTAPKIKKNILQQVHLTKLYTIEK